MKINDIPFNMNFVINPDTLHEKAEDTNEFDKGIDFVRNKVQNTEEPQEAALVKSLLGSLLRITNNFEDSEKYLKESLAFFKDHNITIPAMLTEIRLITTWHYKGDLAKAEDQCRRIIYEIENSKNTHVQKLLDLALFTFGKILLDLKYFPQAEETLTRCLEMRLAKGNQELIENVKFLIQILAERMNTVPKST